MKTRNDFAFEFQKQLAPMVAEDILTSQAAHMMTAMVGDLLMDYADSLTDQIAEKYREWESRIGDDDPTLYTLGLRHAVDVITENDPTSKSKFTADEYLKEIEGNNEEAPQDN